jgi:hypothetical protein
MTGCEETKRHFKILFKFYQMIKDGIAEGSVSR